MKVFTILFLLVVYSNLAFAQETLKTKYQTRDVIINVEKFKFRPISLAISECGVLIVEEAEVRRIRLKSNSIDTLIMLSDFEVLNHRYPIFKNGIQYYQLKNDLNWVNLEDNLMLKVLRSSISFSDSAAVICTKSSPYFSEFIFYNFGSDSVKKISLTDVKQIERVRRRNEMIERQSMEMTAENSSGFKEDLALKVKIFKESQNYFTQKFVVKPDKYLLFNKDSKFIFISTNLNSIFSVNNQGEIISNIKVEWPFSFRHRNKFLLDPITNKVFVIAIKGLNSELYSIDLKGKVKLLDSKLSNVDIENCGVFNNTFYYLKNEIPYGKSLQKLALSSSE